MRCGKGDGKGEKGDWRTETGGEKRALESLVDESCEEESWVAQRWWKNERC